MFTSGIKALVVEILESHSRAIPNRKNFIRPHLSKGGYVDHAKHILEMK